MSTYTFRPLHPLFAAIFHGIEPRQPTDSALPAEVEAAADPYAAPVFHDKELDDSQQMSVNRALGPIAMGPLNVLQRRSLCKEAGVIDIANVDLESRIPQRNDPRLVSMFANRLRGSDSLFKRRP